MIFFLLKEAIDWFSQRPYVNNNGIGVIGVSKGGEIALQMAYHNAKVCIRFHISGENEPSYSRLVFKHWTRTR